jgi:hypothetical protein
VLKFDNVLRIGIGASVVQHVGTRRRSATSAAGRNDGARHQKPGATSRSSTARRAKVGTGRGYSRRFAAFVERCTTACVGMFWCGC